MIRIEDDQLADAASEWIVAQLRHSNPAESVSTSHGVDSLGRFVQLQIWDEISQIWAPDGDTARLAQQLHLDLERNDRDLEEEILLSMLLCPAVYSFPSWQELASAVRIRSGIVHAARRAALAFATHAAERPADYWRYDEDRGFVLLPGKSLITALEKATHSGNGDKLYTFSCRRASEYLVLLGVTREAMTCNAPLYQRLHHQAETNALKGAEFERVFVRAIGSPSAPLPLRYFVPGDRTWFRNIDPVSADVTGYEGSWTFYLGGGTFADFWRQDRAFTLETKLACVYHWRHATFQDAAGELQIDEDKVDALMAESCQSPSDMERILRETLRLQSPLGANGGGCIEPHREHPCLVCPETTDIVLPDAPMV